MALKNTFRLLFSHHHHPSLEFFFHLSKLKFHIRTLLVAQWLRLCTPNAGDPGSTPGQETRSSMSQLRVCMPWLRGSSRHDEDWRSCLLSRFQSCPTLCDPMACSPPGSPSMGFSRQEYWSGLHFLLQCHNLRIPIKKKNFFNEIPYPLNNSSLFPLHPYSWQPFFLSMNLTKYLIWVEYLSFCDWPISL